MKLVSTYKMIALSLISIFIFSSCSKKIEIEKFEGKSEISKGEEAHLDWIFKKADYVLIDGYKEQFLPKGSLKVKTDNSKTYKFTAVNYFDTLKAEWQVNVKGEIQTGADGGAIPEMKESFSPSDYLTGTVLSDNSEADKLKIINFDKNGSAGTLNFLVLDKYGNHIRNLISKNINLYITDSNGENYSITNVKENWMATPRKTLNVSILADNSTAAERNDELLKALQKYSESYKLFDNFNFEWFNNISTYQYHQTSVHQNIFESISKPQPQGFNSIFRNCHKLLEEISGSGELGDIIILYVFSNDNSSIFYDAADIAKLAQEKSVKIYPIIIGTAVNTNAFKYIANSSGGRMYNIDESSIGDAKSILHEIVFGQKSYYNLQFDVSKLDSNRNLVLSLQTGETLLMDNFKMILSPEPQYSDYQAIAGFEFKDTTVQAGFLPNIKILAEVMKKNPAMTVELIGHSGIEGNESITYDLALIRSQNVRRLLLSYGVEPKQIRVVSEGSSKPIYYLEQSAWQTYYNRRVEIRWIVPEQLPYEILAESFPSEELALKKVEEWEKLGYKAYYDRYLKHNNPHYRVRIWGYATIDEANQISSKLKKQYKSEFEVR